MLQIIALMLRNLCWVTKREAVSWNKVLKMSACCVLFVHSCVQVKGTHHSDLDETSRLSEVSDASQKVSFKKELFLAV